MSRSHLSGKAWCFGTRDTGDPDWMDSEQQDDSVPAPVPEDARQTTAAQRAEEEKLEHQDGDPDAPAAQQSNAEIADESTR